MTINNLFKALCFIFITTSGIYAQEDTAIQLAADKACNCITKINFETDNKEKVTEELVKCVKGVSTTAQLPVEIQHYMAKNCPAFKTMISKAYGTDLSTNKEALKHYVEGRNYTTKAQYDLAIASYNKAITIDSKFAAAYNYLADSYDKLGKYNEAITAYKKSLAIKLNDKMPLQNLARAFELSNDYQQAAITYEKFIGLYPEDPEGYYNAGRTFCMSENYEKGTDYLMKAYQKYKQTNSAVYLADTKKALDGTYNILKKQNRLDIYIQAAKKNNINRE